MSLTLLLSVARVLSFLNSQAEKWYVAALGKNPNDVAVQTDGEMSEKPAEINPSNALFKSDFREKKRRSGNSVKP